LAVLHSRVGARPRYRHRGRTTRSLRACTLARH